MKNSVFLGKRFWRPLGLLAAWAFGGWGFLGFRLGLPLGGMVLTAVGIIVFVLMIDGRVIREGAFSLGQALMFMAALPILFLAVAPMTVGFVAGNPWWTAYLLVLAALTVYASVEAYRAIRGGGRGN
jgi:predicted Co/Zn/Cd cation transporter (cation efflux family)